MVMMSGSCTRGNPPQFNPEGCGWNNLVVGLSGGGAGLVISTMGRKKINAANREIDALEREKAGVQPVGSQIASPDALGAGRR
jgi:hypothetical protein